MYSAIIAVVVAVGNVFQIILRITAETAVLNWIVHSNYVNPAVVSTYFAWLSYNCLTKYMVIDRNA